VKWQAHPIPLRLKRSGIFSYKTTPVGMGYDKSKYTRTYFQMNPPKPTRVDVGAGFYGRISNETSGD
jgi:hypothetical protein